MYSNMHGHEPTERELALNAVCSHVCVNIETAFGKLLEKFPFLRLTRTVQLQKRDIAAMMTVAGLLTNMHTCQHGSVNIRQMGDVFPPLLVDYMAQLPPLNFDVDEVFGEEGWGEVPDWML